MHLKSSLAGGQPQPKVSLDTTLVNPTISAQAPPELPPLAIPWNPDVVPVVVPKMAVELYRTDAVVKRSYTPKCAGTVSERSVIDPTPSRRSLGRLVFLLSNCSPSMVSMFTFTMTPSVHDGCTVEQHKLAIHAALQRLRRSGVVHYVWVREHQANGSAHWHIFTDKPVGGGVPGAVDDDLSRDWSRWYASQYEQLGCDPVEVRKMSCGNGADFLGCVRVEQLLSDAAGRYAGKEGGKRFQKKSPVKWIGGGAWWRSSRGLKAVPLQTIQVPVSELASAEIEYAGRVLDIPYRVQFSMGLKASNVDDDMQTG